MKKNFKLYVIVWAILLALFNVAAFVAPAWQTLEKYTPSFWIGYAFITLSFIGQVICAKVAFKDEDAKKLFYNISLFKTSWAGLIATVVFGSIFMVVPVIPYWIGAIVCPLILAINVIAVVKAKVAIDAVVRVDEKVKTQTAFILEIRESATSLLARAKTEVEKDACKKVKEALQYSDPMSIDALAEIEEEIKTHFALFKQAVLARETEKLLAEKDELLALIAERNNKCKMALRGKHG